MANATIEDHLSGISGEIAKGAKNEPARKLGLLIRQMGPVELNRWRKDLDELVEQFAPQRPMGPAARRYSELKELLEGKLGKDDHIEVSDGVGKYEVAYDSPSLAEFRFTLDDLRERHLFQWDTFYKEALDRHLSAAIDEFKLGQRGDRIGTAIGRELSSHAKTIFADGYDYARSKNTGHEVAIQKAVNGFRSFLALPLDFYLLRTSSSKECVDAAGLRAVCSGALAGIVAGFATASFGDAPGNELMANESRAWLSYMAYMTAADAVGVASYLGPGLGLAIERSLLPVLRTLDWFFEKSNPDLQPLPVEVHYIESPVPRLDVLLQPPRRAATATGPRVAVFLAESSTTDIERCAHDRMPLVVAPLRPDVILAVGKKPLLKQLVVVASDKPDITARDCIRILRDAFFTMESSWRGASPLNYNFAKEFPLQSPDEARLFHVTRSSVRDLLRVSDREGHGVRLWCSIRRSGKTTACFDLDSGSYDDAVVVKETCGTKSGNTNDGFIRGFKAAMNAAKTSDLPIEDDFVEQLISKCVSKAASGSDNHGGRVVLVLDEYESLFRHFGVNEDNERLRLNVLEPFLNQLLDFSSRNLVVFLGQQPDAYFVLMDQNQLAPYVRQEPFPLFEHRPGMVSGEFSELVDKVFQGRLQYTAGFVDELFAEVSGHPWLTVNVLVEFVDWLIEQGRSTRDQVHGEDFVRFRGEKLENGDIGLRPELGFFRDYISRNMSVRGFSSNPWVYAIYWVLHGLGEGQLSKNQFRQLVESVPQPKPGLIRPWNELLMQGAKANFLSFDGEAVRAKIRVLGRLAASVRPQVD